MQLNSITVLAIIGIGLEKIGVKIVIFALVFFAFVFFTLVIVLHRADARMSVVCRDLAVAGAVIFGHVLIALMAVARTVTRVLGVAHCGALKIAFAVCFECCAPTS